VERSVTGEKESKINAIHHAESLCRVSGNILVAVAF
jgi:hypothetical protein